jgi:hypothetical protein
MCYGDNGTVKFLETLTDNAFSHNYSRMQIWKKLNYVKILGLPRPTTLNHVIIIKTKFLLTQAYVTVADFDSPI